jgi:predicted secreted hydrolase
MNKKIFYLPILLTVVLILFTVLTGCSSDTADQPNSTQLTQEVTAQETGFSRAAPGYQLVFPMDYGPHENYQTEWWYYTGNLTDQDGRRYGYQLTFFRRALLPPANSKESLSAWATEQVYLGHFALSDIEQEDFYAFERYSRGAVGLADAQSSPFRVWIFDWEVNEVDQDTFELYAQQDGIQLRLTLEDIKGPVLHGENGYSQKGPDPGNASYYYSKTRLQADGNLRINGTDHPVTGSSWMDHEFSTSVLSEEQVGWDWFSIQLDNGYELMLFQIRQADGTIDPFSSGTLIAPDGNTQTLQKSDFNVAVRDEWQSPNSGGIYPAGWDIEIKSPEIRLRITPLQSDQELNLAYTYWEGAVDINGLFKEQAVTGVGYTELTGYSGSFGGEF